MFDLVLLVKTAGYIGLFAIIFAESGLFFGFFLPGDSLLFTAGFLASQEYLHIGWLITVLFVAAVLGDSVGYYFGKKIGPRIFKKENSLFFDREHIERARLFFEKHGGKAVLLARFVPVVRTFTPILAGVGRMKYPVFLLFNFFGGALWAIGLPLLGYFLGKKIPHADRYILPIVLLIIVVSLLPVVFQFLHDKKSRAKLWDLFCRKKNR